MARVMQACSQLLCVPARPYTGRAVGGARAAVAPCSAPACKHTRSLQWGRTTQGQPQPRRHSAATRQRQRLHQVRQRVARVVSRICGAGRRAAHTCRAPLAARTFLARLVAQGEGHQPAAGAARTQRRPQRPQPPAVARAAAVALLVQAAHQQARGQALVAALQRGQRGHAAAQAEVARVLRALASPAAHVLLLLVLLQALLQPVGDGCWLRAVLVRQVAQRR
mmetsp:Transcript_25207/g.64005  ORF Transcript_25207/g.64005 Transcript_25207/m.64005 type:complete len:223 (-) Transcript_25207:1536-2204(-)